jgi:lysophospholipid acyltransferase (LPLAT)-like uncharacterized protein
VSREEEERPAPWRVRLAAVAGALFLRALASTWRIRVVGGEILSDARATHGPVVIALWHGQMLPILWVHRGQGIAILISEHRDGELITRITRSLGCRAVRGSTSRGGGRALLGLVRVLREGGDIAVTPDGPRGPAYTYAPGTLLAAQRSGAPVVSVGAWSAGAWQLGSWDRFMIPKPFARVTVAYSAAEMVAADAEIPGEVPHFRERLNAAVERARDE